MTDFFDARINIGQSGAENVCIIVSLSYPSLLINELYKYKKL